MWSKPGRLSTKFPGLNRQLHWDLCQPGFQIWGLQQSSSCKRETCSWQSWFYDKKTYQKQAVQLFHSIIILLQFCWDFPQVQVLRQLNKPAPIRIQQIIDDLTACWGNTKVSKAACRAGFKCLKPSKNMETLKMRNISTQMSLFWPKFLRTLYGPIRSSNTSPGSLPPPTQPQTLQPSHPLRPSPLGTVHPFPLEGSWSHSLRCRAVFFHQRNGPPKESWNESVWHASWLFLVVWAPSCLYSVDSLSTFRWELEWSGWTKATGVQEKSTIMKMRMMVGTGCGTSWIGAYNGGKQPRSQASCPLCLFSGFPRVPGAYV